MIEQNIFERISQHFNLATKIKFTKTMHYK